MRGNIKYFGLIALLTFCVAFSLISLWETQSLATADNPTLIVQNTLLGFKHELNYTEMFPSPTPVESVVPPSDIQQLAIYSEESSAEPSLEPSPSIPVQPSPTPSINNQRSKPSLSPPTRKSPSISPSITPTPFAIFIPHSIHGNRSVERENFLDTTTNTPLQVHLESIFGDWILEVPQFTAHQPSHGTLLLNKNDPRNITYIPKDWYNGLDSFEIEAIRFLDGVFVEWNASVNIRIRTGVVLNQVLLTPPTSYNFSEANGPASNEIRKSLKYFQNKTMVPQEEGWLNRRYRTCAVVGNGGSLIGSKRGAEIDSHEIVVRLNMAPFLNFSADVGSKMDIAMSNGPSFSNCWRRNETDFPGKPEYEILFQASFKSHWMKLPTCVKFNPNIKYTPMNYLFVDMVDQILNDYQSSLFNSTAKKYRSTGMMSVIAMSMICDHVSAYGFERGPLMESHYYKNTKDREWNGHSYEAEKAFFKDLAHGKGIFEKHLKLYDLYSSFSYIVD